MTDRLLSVDSDTKLPPASVQAVWAADLVAPAAAAAAASKVDKGTLRINAADYASLKDALAAANTPGAYVFVPYKLGGWVNAAGLGNGATVMADDVTIEMAVGAVVMVQTWGQAGIDCIGRSGVKILGGRCDFVGTRVSGGSGSYRGSNETSGTAGVWINKDRCTVDGLRTVNMPVGVYLSSWNGSTSQDRQGVGNTVRNTEHEGMDFGVLWTGQQGLRITNVYGHDDIDDSAGVNPTHVLYGASSTSAFPSDDVVISNCIAKNLLSGHAYQFKYHTNSKAKNLVARNSVGVLSLLGCTDSDFDVSLVGAKETSISPQGWVICQDSSTARLKINADIAVDGTGADHRAIHFFGFDSEITATLVTRRKTNGAASVADVRILGTGNRVRVNDANVGAYPAPTVQVGDSTNASTNNRVSIGRVSGCSRLVDFYDTGGGSVDYASDHVSLSTSTFVSTQSGSPSYRVFSAAPPVPPPSWSPVDNGFLGATFDPALSQSNQAVVTAGVLSVARIRITENGTIGNAMLHVGVAGSGLTSAQCLLGIYNSVGTLIGKSADLSGVLNSTGLKTIAVTAESGQSLAVLTGAIVYVGLLQNGTTPAQLRGPATGAVNANVSGFGNRFSTMGTGQTALPTPLASLASGATQPVVAVMA
jgi:hypothetical protein